MRRKGPGELGALFVFLALLLFSPVCLCGKNWAPIPENELKLTSVPGYPAATAVLLYRDSYRDHIDEFCTEFLRIKVLAEAGKTYAEVTIPFVTRTLAVSQIEARTVQPDGTAKEFNGPFGDDITAGPRGTMVRAKVFRLPDVHVGTIIEYKYRQRYPTSRTETRWRLQHELFTLRAHFSIRPEKTWSVSKRMYLLEWVTYGLPAGSEPKEKSGRVEFEIENVPPLPTEDYLPPADEASMHIRFFYREDGQSRDQYWKSTGKRIYENWQSFIGNPKGMPKAVARMTAFDDPPEQKLRKICAEVQKLRNVSLQQEITNKKQEDQTLRAPMKVEDVLKLGYGTASALNLLFLTLVRTAGFDAWLLRVADRDVSTFDPNVLSSAQLTSTVVVVVVNGKEVVLDPGTAFCPYGLIPWQKTDSPALRPTREGSDLVRTPDTTSHDSVVVRRANLTLSENHTLSGTVEITYAGQRALQARQNAHLLHEAERTKNLEDEVKSWLPQGATAKLVKVGNWESSDFTLAATFAIEVPGFGKPADGRRSASLAIFTPRHARSFSSPSRVTPVYFGTAFSEEDDIAVTLPAGYAIESLPEPRKVGPAVGSYQRSYERQGTALRLRRTLLVNESYFGTERYPELRAFFTALKAHDDEAVVFRTGAN